MKFVPVSDNQRSFVRDEAHRVVIALGGRGSGKTHVAVAKALRVALEFPGSQMKFVAPDLERLEEGLLNKFRQMCPPDLLTKEYIHKRRFELANGCTVNWRSVDIPGGLRAGEQNFDVFDEAAWAPYSQAKRAVGDLLANLRLEVREFRCPNIWIPDRPWIEVLERGSEKSLIRVTYKQQLAITTTPAIGSFINEMLEGGDPPHIRTYRLKTEENPHLPEGYLEQLREAYGTEVLWRQEALGELVGVESAHYPMFDPKRHVMAGPVDYKIVVGGIDWGYSQKLAIVVYGFTSSGVCFGLEEFVADHVTSDRLILKAQELMEKHKIQRYFCDPAEPRSIADLNIHGIPASKAITVDRMYRASRVASRLEKGTAGAYRFYLNPGMKETIRAFKFAGETVEDPKKIKEVKSGRPGDDPLDATEYAICGGEMLMGAPISAVFGRTHKRHEGERPAPLSVPYRLL